TAGDVLRRAAGDRGRNGLCHQDCEAGTQSSDRKPTACVPWVADSAGTETHGTQAVGLKFFPMSDFSAILPHDEHNQTLLQHVHPRDWVNPKPAPRYNLVVIGAGTAGLVAAAGAAGLGAKVALVERELLGGDCLNVGG